MNILEKIVESKKLEIAALYRQYDAGELARQASGLRLVAPGVAPAFYTRLADARAAGVPFFISEFKRKSPSEGWIAREAGLPAQVQAYAAAGAGAISVLTDGPFFGGTYEDLQSAATTLEARPGPRPLLLQKDFVLDPIQIYLARLHGADLILLIAAILEPDRLDFLKKTAENLGMGVLVEVHDAEELDKVGHLDFPVLGINNRDLKTFRTALNRANVLARGQSPRRFIVAESGVRDYLDFQVLRGADVFLIGTGLMRAGNQFPSFRKHFGVEGRTLFKACGIRTPETIAKLASGAPSDAAQPDLVGINFSPASKRRIDGVAFEALKQAKLPNVVAVFYKNPETEIRSVIEEYPFRAVQLYAGDVTPELVRSLKQRVILAVRVDADADWADILARHVEPYAADVDFFILDGAAPGSGQRIGTGIPADFPWPFLLAGGINESNLDAIAACKNCMGVDIASGIETGGLVDLDKVGRIAASLAGFLPV